MTGNATKGPVPRGKKTTTSRPAKSRRRKAVALGQVTKPLMATALRKKGLVQSEITAKWSQIVGADLARGCVPMGIKFPPGERFGGSLQIRTIPAFAPMLQHRQQEIIDLVNRFFGFGAVARLALSQGPLPVSKARRKSRVPVLSERDKEALKQEVGVRDDGLSDVLAELAWSIRHKQD